METAEETSYDWYQCKVCRGVGEKHDPTMAEWIGNRGSSLSRCYACSGAGKVGILKGCAPRHPCGVKL